MADPIYLTVPQVLEIQAVVLAAHGGAGGLRDRALLESAVHAPQAGMGGRPLLIDPVEIAAAYLFYLCRNHPFFDGNKRTALASSLVFLRLNGLHPEPDGPKWEALMFDVATSRLDREATAARLGELVGRPQG
jgi:death-on-curing protein